MNIFQYLLLLEQIIEFLPGILLLRIRLHGFYCSGLKIVTEIGGGFIAHELGLFLPALVAGGLGIEPAIETAMQDGAAFRTRLLPSDFAGRLERSSARMAIHPSTLLFVLSGIIPF